MNAQRAAGAQQGPAPRAIGILGGTFDPPHLGHLAVAREAQRLLDLASVLFVPNADPPHKGDTVTPAAHREAMVRLAIAGEPAFELSRIELERPGPSYAVDTVSALAERSRAEGRPEPWFILSADALRDFPTWRDPGRILQHCRLAVAPRPGAPAPRRAWLDENIPAHAGRVVLLPGPLVDLASTDIRARAARGEDLAALVPAAVAEYIVAHGLYRDTHTDRTIEKHAAAAEESAAVSDEQARAEGAANAVEASGSVSSAEASQATAADPRRAPRPGLPVTRRERKRPAPTGDIAPVEVDPAVLALAHRVVELAADKKASDIVLLDVREQTTMTDYFVICSGASDRQLGAIADGIVEGVKDEGHQPLSREGEASSHWVLIDLGGVIVHVMSVPEREFYQLEKLWAQASLLLHVV